MYQASLESEDDRTSAAYQLLAGHCEFDLTLGLAMAEEGFMGAVGQPVGRRTSTIIGDIELGANGKMILPKDVVSILFEYCAHTCPTIARCLICCRLDPLFSGLCTDPLLHAHPQDRLNALHPPLNSFD
jgi:hypothetical protein